MSGVWMRKSRGKGRLRRCTAKRGFPHHEKNGGVNRNFSFGGWNRRKGGVGYSIYKFINKIIIIIYRYM